MQQRRKLPENRPLILFVALICLLFAAATSHADELQIEKISVEPIGVRTDIEEVEVMSSPGGMSVNLPRFDLYQFQKEVESTPFEPGAIGVEDTAAPRQSMAPAVGNNFVGIEDTGWFPPDGGIAAGPRYLVSVTNGAVTYQTKDGENVFQTSLTAFFNSDTSAFDPRVLYDQGVGRFVILAASGARDSAKSKIWIAMSNSNNPRDGWCFYNPFTGADPAGTWADYPTLGVNKDAVFFGANQFDSGFSTNRMMWMPKADMASCSSTTAWVIKGLQLSGGADAFTVQPAHNFSTSDQFLATTDDIALNKVRLYRINDPIGSPSVTAGTDVSVGTFNFPPLAPQPGGGVSLHTGDVRILHLVKQGNSLWMSHTGAGFSCGTGSCSVIHYKEFNMGGFPAVSVVQDNYYGAGNYYYMYPAIAVNSANDVAVSFSRTSAANGEYPSSRHTGRLGTDTPNTLQGSAQLQAGLANYQEIDSNGRNRWGDYFGASIDTCSNKGMWVESQYSVTSTTWNKWVANTFSQSSPSNNTCLPGIYISAFPYTNTQDTTYATFEEQDLVQSCGSSVYEGNNGSVWYYFEAPGNGTVTIDTFDSDYDTVLSAYSENGACANLTELACNDQYGSNQSQISFPVTAGEFYDVLITEWSAPSCNTQTLELHAYFEAAKPDLVVQSIVTDPVSPAPGETVNVTVTVANQGLGDATTSFWIDFYDHLTTPPSPAQIGTFSCNPTGLSAGGTYDCIGTVSYAAAGTYDMYAQVDTDQEVSETNETNNVLGPQTITVASTLPDVSLTLVPDSTSITRPGVLGYQVSVVNNSASTQCFDYWTNVKLPNGNMLPPVGAFFGPIHKCLIPGQSVSAHLSHPVPATAPVGSYVYNAFLGTYPAGPFIDEFHFSFTVN